MRKGVFCLLLLGGFVGVFSAPLSVGRNLPSLLSSQGSGRDLFWEAGGGMKVRGWSSFAFYSGMETVLIVPVREARRQEIRRRRPVRLPPGFRHAGNPDGRLLCETGAFRNANWRSAYFLPPPAPPVR